MTPNHCHEYWPLWKQPKIRQDILILECQCGDQIERDANEFFATVASRGHVYLFDYSNDMLWHTRQGRADWKAACSEIQSKTSGLETHQRIEVYRLGRVDGLSHAEAMDKAMGMPVVDLPHIVFEKA